MPADGVVLSRSATFRFYADLNDFLPAHRRQKTFIHKFDLNASAKDMIESLGVPHPEIDMILANGRPVDFSYLVQDGDRITVYPFFTVLAPDAFNRVRPAPLDLPRFVLDVHLGQLARYLRMFGFDTLYRINFDDEVLARISSAEQRILLTRDRGLLKRSLVVHGYCLRTTRPRQQLLDVLRRFDLFDAIRPFQRCINCNGRLEPVDKTLIRDQLPARIWAEYDEFRRCQACHQIYWQGSHLARMERFIRGILPAKG
ncbi:MAG: Mut7-C ubiquitin/RNAse domain-containing protein [Anaerolineae bacterium]|nr:Mut7-C ubiquitin/RNAse domain-containing protein [Anaerolineae bacterium]